MAIEPVHKLPLPMAKVVVMRLAVGFATVIAPDTERIFPEDMVRVVANVPLLTITEAAAESTSTVTVWPVAMVTESPLCGKLPPQFL